ncbi:MAG: cardiolipin synthase [Rhodothermales bacterium]|nr:cardiolipin synthase [Rhodothermales bacterium]
MDLWTIVIIITHFVVAPFSAGHALLFKRDPRSAVGWISACLLFPIFGPIAYGLFGINRVESRARLLHEKRRTARIGFERGEQVIQVAKVPNRRELPKWLRPIRTLSASVTRNQLVGGNRVVPLFDGEQAYPRMLEAIGRASTSIVLMTYILDTDKSGRQFVAALADAVKRGVDVRVLVDGFGERYSRPRAWRLLSDAGVRVERFLPIRLVPPSLHLNLRNHRKLLLIDNSVAFAGGMNIGDRHLVSDPDNKRPTQDLHFEFKGPIVSQLLTVFAETWAFVADEQLPPAIYSDSEQRHRQLPADVSAPDAKSDSEIPSALSTNKGLLTPSDLDARNEDALHQNHSRQDTPDQDLLEDASQPYAQCRVVVDGPDNNLDKLETVLNGAIASARRSIMIMTPYFLPSREMIAFLKTASLKGVDVTVVIPERTNLWYVQAATHNLIGELLQYGVRILRQPSPFSHSKMVIIDKYYCVVGSANIDARSLRLNFELGIEVISKHFADSLLKYVDERIVDAKAYTLEEVDGRSLPVRLRDAFCWLFVPYL